MSAAEAKEAKPPRPRPTRNYATAAQRLAERMGFGLESSGRAWILTAPTGYSYPPMNAKRVLGHLLDIATAQTWDTEAQESRPPMLTYRQCAAVCRLSVPPRLIEPRYWWLSCVLLMQKAAHAQDTAER
ncbi:MAG: hypothetical protein OXU74_06550 [Gemmatimonadota bacterium]|nr:hypothetical protein [Gemmatimonadota bacterium]